MVYILTFNIYPFDLKLVLCGCKEAVAQTQSSLNFVSSFSFEFVRKCSLMGKTT